MNPNDPAFPIASAAPGVFPSQGITVRLYIAAQIMAAMMSNPQLKFKPGAEKYGSAEAALAAQSLDLADALIAADKGEA